MNWSQVLFKESLILFCVVFPVYLVLLFKWKRIRKGESVPLIVFMCLLNAMSLFVLNRMDLIKPDSENSKALLLGFLFINAMVILYVIQSEVRRLLKRVRVLSSIRRQPQDRSGGIKAALENKAVVKRRIDGTVYLVIVFVLLISMTKILIDTHLAECPVPVVEQDTENEISEEGEN